MDFVNTERMGEMLGIKPGSIRAQYCQTGGYFGVVPKKMPNGRLLWDLRDIEALLQRAA